jgi:hypothetical protein
VTVYKLDDVGSIPEERVGSIFTTTTPIKNPKTTNVRLVIHGVCVSTNRRV